MSNVKITAMPVHNGTDMEIFAQSSIVDSTANHATLGATLSSVTLRAIDEMRKCGHSLSDPHCRIVITATPTNETQSDWWQV